MTNFGLRIALVIIVLTLTNVFCIAEDNAPSIAKKSCKGVAFLKGYRNGKSIIGTGFLLDDRVLITNAHVVAGANTMVAEFDGGEKIDCSIIDSNSQLDLAALALDRPLEKRALTRKDIKVEQGDRVFLIGHPLGLKWSFHSGSVAAIRTVGQIAENLGLPKPSNSDQKAYQLSVTSTFGMSGAPVLNRDGDVIGIEKEGWGDGLGGINFCIPQECVDLLDLRKKPTTFPGGVRLDDNFKKVGLQKQNLERPELKVDGRAVDIGCQHWGYVEPNADIIFARYIGDKERFGSIIPKNVVQEILRRHQVVHVTNSAFGLSFLTPDNYELSQSPQNDPPGLIITLSNRDRVVPVGCRVIKIYASRISAPDGSALSTEVVRIAESFARNILNLRIHDLATRPRVATPDDVGINLQNSDQGPRVDPVQSLAHYHVTYSSMPLYNRSWNLYAAIAGETATVTAYPYMTNSRRPGVTSDAAERQFIAETLSFDALNRGSP